MPSVNRQVRPCAGFWHGTGNALGKNSDQIGRLFSEPAELLVLQHCHEVTTAVVDMMDTYAHDLRSPRTYMIIDGPIPAAS